MKLSGVVLYVMDVEKLKQFYSKYFQCEVIEETPGQWVLLKAGNGELGLHKIGAAYTGEADNNSGENSNAKLVFETTEDIFLMHQQLRNNDINVREVKTWDGYGFWLCDGEDPEGNIFQIKQKKIDQ
jgi:catechol-2,3-dioxygenase